MSRKVFLFCFVLILNICSKLFQYKYTFVFSCFSIFVSETGYKANQLESAENPHLVVAERRNRSVKN